MDEAGDEITRSLADKLSYLLSGDVVAAASSISKAQGPLFPCEEAEIAAAAPVRKAEFRAGRTVARSALAALGVAAQPIPRTNDRRPVWPAGIVGSITHSGTLCAAIAARNEHVLGLGVDLEPATPLEPSLYSTVGRPNERVTFEYPIKSGADSVDRGKLVFAIKEAVFKAYYPVTEVFLDYQDATITVDPGGQFSVRLVQRVPALPGHPIFLGRWALVGDHILAVLRLKRVVDAPPRQRDAASLENRLLKKRMLGDEGDGE